MDDKFDGLGAEFGGGRNFQKSTVDKMMQQSARGIEYFSREYHVGKNDKTHGFKMICEDTLKRSKTGRKGNIYQNMMNRKTMKGKDVVKAMNDDDVNDDTTLRKYESSVTILLKRQAAHRELAIG
eukprot:361206_1